MLSKLAFPSEDSFHQNDLFRLAISLLQGLQKLPRFLTSLFLHEKHRNFFLSPISPFRKVITLTLYARSDVMSVSIPPASGGCGNSHTRPVRNGAPDRIFKLTCPDCEGYLKGDRKAKILRTSPGDVKAGIPAKQERVADSDPHWSSTPDTVPLTPDETQTRHLKIEKGEQQLRALESLIALKSGGIDVTSRPEVLYFLQQSGLTGEMLQGQVVCPAGHENSAGVKFCGECGISMNAQKEITATPDDIPLDMLHIATLRKKCREAGLNDKGKKNELIARLTT